MEYVPSFRDQLQNGSNPSWLDDVVDYELYHHGIKGQKWGVRRPRNEDGIIQGAGAALAKKQRKLRSKANENARVGQFARNMANKIQADADVHGAKARGTRNIIKKVGHRAAQLWDTNAAVKQRQIARRFEKKAAKQNYKADRLQAKKELKAWGDKANKQYAKDHDNAKIARSAEQAMDRFNASNKAAKQRYKRAKNADRITRTQRRAKRYGTIASMNRNMSKAMTNKSLGVARLITAPAAAAGKVNEAYYTHRQNAMNRKIRRLSN